MTELGFLKDRLIAAAKAQGLTEADLKGATLTITLPKAMPPSARVTAMGRVTAPHHVIRSFDHKCKDCGWEGPGKDLKTGEVHEDSCIIDYDCPKCHEWIAFSYPVDEHGRPV